MGGRARCLPAGAGQVSQAGQGTCAASPAAALHTATHDDPVWREAHALDLAGLPALAALLPLLALPHRLLLTAAGAGPAAARQLGSRDAGLEEAQGVEEAVAADAF